MLSGLPNAITGKIHNFSSSSVNITRMLDPWMTINCRGRLLSLENPVVMGVLNLTSDSFFDGGRYATEAAALNRVERMLSEGAAIIDIGGMSSRPGAEIISEEEELHRVMPHLESILFRFPEALISIDTVWAKVAGEAVNAGAAMINDISAGKIDPEMYRTAAQTGAPYVLMHMQGTPFDMQRAPVYEDVVRETLDFFITEIGKLKVAGVKDIILDPGFGFGKTVEHNYRLLNNLHVFQIPGLPVLTGLSRKSMICKVLKVNPDEALNGTTALHMVALQQGSRILRVHDVREAVEVIKLWQQLEKV
jgi:dihydropteroate synthase